jgi:hypothetical protein
MLRRYGTLIVVALAVAGTAILASGSVVSGELVAPGKPAPEIAKGAWVNSEPLTIQALRGKVVLVDFWTYG